MVANFRMRTHSLPLATFIISKPRFFPNLTFRSHPLSLCPLYVASTSTTTLSQALSYGPSLQKGHKPSQYNPPLPKPSTATVHKLSEERRAGDDVDDLIDRENFTRIFDVAALQVPAKHCFVLESRLRGHLLNWPRIRNIARIPGDEVEEGESLNLLKIQNINSYAIEDCESLAPLNRVNGKTDEDGEQLSPVLYRDNLARTFSSRGFVKFGNLARLSRPKKRKKLEGQKKGIGKNEYAMVEIVEEEEKGEEEEDDFSGLLGFEFKARKWRGSTRLLLLDEKHAGKSLDQLPGAIKAVLKEDSRKDTVSSFRLLRCRLTLFYNYWQLNEILEVLLPKGMIVPSAFETVGHIAHLNLRDEHLLYKKIIAQVVLDKNKPKIRTVVNKIDAIHNDYRTMQLEVLAGNHSLVTTVFENGLRFHVDLATVYWNSRLATERRRLLNYFTSDDIVCDVFAGVGPIAISAARKVKYVYANDLNPHAIEYLQRNCILNKLERKIEVFNMDGRRFINTVFTSLEAQFITQVVMNLPNNAAENLDVFRGIFRTRPKDGVIKLPKIHVYGFSKAQDPEFDFHERIRVAMSEVAFEVEMRRVRLVAPGKWMLCASFILPESVAFAKIL
ncbi:tRNA (guanine(37)-N1)-methyltransferase 1 isoform X2 [Diospyros lotus]|uniref:tRNA (guanine(37)-N1)-methyltransferase 1 isoform X2 n=1 Tax=Diospyros lotus TaxID=55363 RepID=UPI00224FFB6E|nr:tRNA (guanine(37)-N1)-methyltransferase 1 isoform X2 [Diospyros lotus]